MTTGHGSINLDLFPGDTPETSPLPGLAVVELATYPVTARVILQTRAQAAGLAAAFLSAIPLLPDDGEPHLTPVCNVCGAPAHLPALADAGDDAPPGHQDAILDADHDVEVGYAAVTS